MTGGFYEELGVDRTASSARIRQAYGVSVSRLAKRRRALLEQGGATVQLDLQRARLDEAWAVLSDPLRRRRYDAMLGWTDGDRTRDPDAVWGQVGEALVHPAAAVAVKLLRVTSRLPELGQLPLAPSAAEEEPPTLIPHDDDLTSPRIGRTGRATAPTGRGAARAAPPPSAPPASTPAAPSAPALAMPRPSGPRAAPSIAPPMLATPAPVDPRDLIELTPAPVTDRAAPQRTFPSAPPAPRAPGSAPPLSYASPAPFSQAPTASPAQPRSAPPAPKVTALAPEVVSALVDDHGWSGRMLALVRQKMGLPLQEVADHTRIGLKYLEAIESEAREKLPSSTFVRGYVREMARLYQLDEAALVTGYMRRFDGA